MSIMSVLLTNMKKSLSFRLFFLNPNIKKKAFILGISLSAFLLYACQYQKTQGQLDNKASSLQFQTILSSPIASLDPLIGSSDLAAAQVLMNLFAPLVVVDSRTQQYHLNLIDHYHIDQSHLIYQMHIQAHARWSNGDPITASDAVFSIKRTLNPKNGSYYALFLGSMIAQKNHQPLVKALNEKTFQITLSHPVYYFIGLMNNMMFSIVPKKAVQTYGNQWTKKAFWSSGPYELASYHPGYKIVLKANPYYWDAAHVQIKTLTFWICENSLTAYRLYQTHKIDMDNNIFPLSIQQELAKQWQDFRPLTLSWTPYYLKKYKNLSPPQNRAQFSQWLTQGPVVEKTIADEQTVFAQIPYKGYYVLVNTQKKYLSPLVRQALNLAINKKTLCYTLLKDGSQPAYEITPLGFSKYIQKLHKLPVFNPSEAQRLLAKAGYPQGKNFPVIHYIYTDYPHDQWVAQFLQNSWQKYLNIRVELTKIPQKQLYSVWKNHDYDLSSFSWSADFADPSSFLSVLTGKSSNNDSGFSNTQFDSLFYYAQIQNSPLQAYPILHKAENMALKFLPLIPLYFPIQFTLLNHQWYGFYPNPGSIYYYYLFYTQD